jgi:hypothetical protein
MYNGIRLVNLYAPSGTEKRQEREKFFNINLPHLLPGSHMDLILVGDFNCVLSHSDATGQRNYSRALDKLVTGLDLYDFGERTSTRLSFAHYTPRGSSRIDRIYISNTLKRKRQGVATVAADFTDHLAVVLRMASTDPIPTSGRGFWQMNSAVLGDVGFRQILQGKWETWRGHRKYYPTAVMWWEGYIKSMR